MKPIEEVRLETFANMRTQYIPENKNYFAMSLKHFFKNLSDDQLEFMCHHYVHNWINEEL